ncbi:MAG: hypothetical protein A2496_24430 [Burkholderiales bacterium RIFOXYC12_FULL_60_6]|nr:MAG: hypothetical protein A2496_24430 [Burkholderiales bacterium RIFOXYC12_FULL_60_6]
MDNGIAHIKANATKMMLIKAYSAGDSYATVVGNKIAEVTVTTTDFTLSTSGSDRLVTGPSSKSAAASASSGATPALHIAFTNGSDKVLWVTDETSDQVVTSGNTVNFPDALVYTSYQPTIPA